VIDVANPVGFDSVDDKIICLIDAFLRTHDEQPIQSVANTIFPQSLYQKHGHPAFIDEYLGGFDQFHHKSRNWGRYFERMCRERTGKDGVLYRPISRLIKKLSKQTDSPQRFKAAYELAIYDADLDSKPFRNRPCLSFLSFKRHPADGLLLTAIYRNHTYITRCLGNLIGLGRLMAFVAKESQLKVGSLTVISTRAEIDEGTWGIVKARELISEAQNFLDRPSELQNIRSI
jgi:thymidylate synthase